MEARKIKAAVLGASGSIGKNARSVLSAARADFEPVLFSAHRDTGALIEAGREYPGAVLALSGGGSVEELRAAFPGRRIYEGREGLLEAIGACGAAVFVHGIAGAAGLEPSLAVLREGATLALANKESVVMAWRLVDETARRHGARIIPVDSEHSAVFNLINAHCADGRDEAREIILTASGGPFRSLSREALAEVTVEAALRHPTWNMGAKITIDSASLANKGLEVIEAARLFAFAPERVRVAVHPESVVHAMIRTGSGALYAELSQPDMRLPIHNALYYPRRVPCPFARLDPCAPVGLDLHFEAPDTARFPMLRLAYAALEAGELYTVAYNAANEEAVALFMRREIGFTRIAEITERLLARDWSGEASCLDAVFDADKRARKYAAEM